MQSDPLPYRDTKPIGAADFYFAINATFRFILATRGIEGLRRYWRDLGKTYMLPVTERWQRGGLVAVAEYWKEFFQAEPGSQVDVSLNAEEVTLSVHSCPAIAHLRRHDREIVACFCQHCYFVSNAMAEPAGISVRVKGGNGSCIQTFRLASADDPPQDLQWIKEAQC